LKERINEAARIGEEFTKIYYEHIDKKKSTQRLYLDTALLVFNGNGISGVEPITKFQQELPSMEHTLTTLDAQPILDSAAGKSYLIQTSGTVKIDNQRSQAFQQSFLITAHETKWKIVTDTFRLQNSIYG
jgi:NTF2-related export protein 1/2